MFYGVAEGYSNMKMGDTNWACHCATAPAMALWPWEVLCQSPLANHPPTRTEKSADAGRRPGARQLLISAKRRALFEEIAARVDYVGLTTYLTFTGAYMTIRF